MTAQVPVTVLMYTDCYFSGYQTHRQVTQHRLRKCWRLPWASLLQQHDVSLLCYGPCQQQSYAGKRKDSKIGIRWSCHADGWQSLIEAWSCARRVKILQTPSKVELERQAVERTKRSSQSRLALPNPHHQDCKIPALPAPEGELFGLPTDSARAPLKYLNFIDRNNLRAICRAARNLVDFDLANVVVHFTYQTEFFDSIPRCTRSGRIMNNGHAGHGRRLLGFLRRHAGLLQQLDLRRAPTLDLPFLISTCIRIYIYIHIFILILRAIGVWNPHLDGTFKYLPF